MGLKVNITDNSFQKYIFTAEANSSTVAIEDHTVLPNI